MMAIRSDHLVKAAASMLAAGLLAGCSSAAAPVARAVVDAVTPAATETQAIDPLGQAWVDPNTLPGASTLPGQVGQPAETLPGVIGQPAETLPGIIGTDPGVVAPPVGEVPGIMPTNPANTRPYVLAIPQDFHVVSSDLQGDGLLTGYRSEDGLISLTVRTGLRSGGTISQEKAAYIAAMDPHRTITYDYLGSNRFVVSGTEGVGREYYVATWFSGDTYVRMDWVWDTAAANRIDSLITNTYRSFRWR